MMVCLLGSNADVSVSLDLGSENRVVARGWAGDVPIVLYD